MKNLTNTGFIPLHCRKGSGDPNLSQRSGQTYSANFGSCRTRANVEPLRGWVWVTGLVVLVYSRYLRAVLGRIERGGSAPVAIAIAAPASWSSSALFVSPPPLASAACCRSPTHPTKTNAISERCRATPKAAEERETFGGDFRQKERRGGGLPARRGPARKALAREFDAAHWHWESPNYGTGATNKLRRVRPATAVAMGVFASPSEGRVNQLRVEKVNDSASSHSAATGGHASKQRALVAVTVR